MTNGNSASCQYCDGTGSVHRIDGEYLGECTECPASVEHQFKNFHGRLCERFGYVHDELDWKRDQVSLIEWIAKLSICADGGKDSSAALAEDEADDFIRTVDEFGDTGEAMTDYDMLMDWARRGLLECTHFEVTAAGHDAIDAIAKEKT